MVTHDMAEALLLADRVLVMDADQAIGELYDGRMNSTSVIIALQWLTLRRDELRQRWAISTKRD